ncbi:hypothetical protein SERLA73DRAFT_76353 [Serpula lacrymans var. lacrymans S7.3]|uniref:Peptidase A1 domain-containing protein n=2 Tax=Serpula lacrymans var. lacrymans TaxID=341189 RepID=F8Q5C3_SERL3|nr:uncharacterized protein SERLADRAFT_441152 [Serpula lacrymans var. lacrymans S7.9]EGN96394.1 hypothetical protein SERLA73DRAFT_76353 [Serpula lacrymans var. lacrymans S7.3]EGO21935.1 hypothetical protein SERLADRAFT_441152 [Serpula lacrymans var. lacrymans S7.9]
MYLKPILPFVVLPFLVSALPQPLRTATIPLNKRSSLRNADGTVDLDAVHAHISRVEWKIQRGFEAYGENAGVEFPQTRPQVAKRVSGSIPLIDDSNDRWYGSILVGTLPSLYTVDFDTGSSDLFLPGPECGSTCGGHTLYSPNASSTSKDLGRTFSLSYGDGSTVSGEQYSDSVQIAGYTATSQTLGVANQYSSSFTKSQFPPDGLMGMAFPILSVYGANPVFQTLVSEGVLPEPVFAFKLASSGSELCIGGTNPSLYQGSFTYTPVTFAAYWQINIDSLNANNAQIIGGVSGIIDTGTTLIVANTSNVNQFYSALNGTDVGGGSYTLPCDSMPSISITLGGTSFTMSPDTFNIGAYDSTGEACVGAVSANDGIGDFWVLGDAFLRNVYTVFDVGNSRVGYAQLA